MTLNKVVEIIVFNDNSVITIITIMIITIIKLRPMKNSNDHIFETNEHVI